MPGSPTLPPCSADPADASSGAHPPSPSPRSTGTRGLLRTAGRLIGSVVFVLCAALLTVGFLRCWVHAKRLATPIIVTPAVPAREVDSPPWSAVLSQMATQLLVRLHLRKDPRPRVIALTFDDGPYPVTTPQLLNLLERHHVKATFFVIGKDAEMQPELVRRIADAGFELGNHSYTHPSFVGLDAQGITNELLRTDRLLRNLTGISPAIMRPPGGRLDPSRYRLIHRLGYTVVNDNDNPGDWRQNDPNTIYSFTLTHSGPGTIICMHSGILATIHALPLIIDTYRKRGYHFVTVSELARLEHNPVPSLPPAPR